MTDNYSPHDVETLLAAANAAIPNQLDEAQTQARAALALLHEEDNESAHIEAHVILGICGYYRADFAEAITHLERADQRLQNQPVPDDVQWARTLTVLASVYRQLGDFTTATNLFERGLQHARQSGQSRPQMSALNGLASISSNLNNPRMALMYLEEALTLAQATQDERAEGTLLCNIGHEYVQLDEYEKALQHGQAGVDALKSMNRPPDALFGLMALTKAYEGLDKLTEARATLEEALQIAQQYGIGNLVPQILYMLGQFEWHHGDADQALAYLEAARTSLDAEYHPMIYGLYELTAEIYAARGDYERAYQFSKQMNEWRAQTHSEETRQAVANLEIRYKVAQAQQHAAEIEAQRQRDQDYFQRINQIRDEFIQSASHDMRNPLARIKLSTSIIRRYHGDLSEAVLHRLDQIDHSVALMVDLTSEILELLRYESGRDIHREWQPLQPLLDELALSFGDQAQQNGVQLQIESSLGLQASYDFKLLRRALHNLVGNALRHTASGGEVVIGVAQHDGGLILSVLDTGSGIPPEDLPHIFDRFYRGSQLNAASYKQHLSGTGMGLAITKSIVEAHRGSIAVASEVGKGTRFTVTIPLNQPA